MHNDLGDHPRFGGDFEAALGSIQARTIILKAETDRYIPPVDSEYEANQVDSAQARPIPTIWGHLAPFNPQDQAFIDKALTELPAAGRVKRGVKCGRAPDVVSGALDRFLMVVRR
jgi:homoserine O-acetyltransferase